MARQISFLEEQKQEIYISTKELKSIKKLSVISLFSGCGGMDLGFRGGFDFLNNSYEKNPYDIVFASDIKQKACDTYTHNFKHNSYCIDIRDLDYSLLPKTADIIIGGFPCQDFSLAGKRKGLSSERGKLYLEMKKIIEYVRPIAFVAENVDGIRKSNLPLELSPLEIIVEDFKNIGYKVKYKVLNAADYGVPQNRVRVIIIGIRQDINKTIKYPSPTHGADKTYNHITSKSAIDDLWFKLGSLDVKNHTQKDFSRAKFYPGKKMQGNMKIKANSPSPTIRAEHHGNIEGHYRSLCDKEPDNVLNWRRLSVRECARLQSFPDDFEWDCSASEAYKQIGNAVPPVMAWHIARALYNSLNN
ncbi:MAG: DNA cytosine methyltransferase [Defluviitaleaceae bacterium]|nr:DNA cytosine methyltransferase [Defluviitaleaceae bacterium]